jgi:hypothetical protein
MQCDVVETTDGILAYQMPNTHARILPEQDFLVMIRHAGVYALGAGSHSSAKRRRT